MSGAENVDSNDDDSFIILGTSPGSSLDMKCGTSPDASNLEDALRDLSDEATMAFKAHFQLGDCPSPGSMMVASTMVTDEATTGDLQKLFGELLDENLILRETLKQNNDSMKEQFLLIASYQEDMMKTQVLHKEKFDETKDLVERLRLENKKLKQDLQRKNDVSSQTSDAESSAPSSVLEFVSSPDDDTINKLTAQLELIEKQRRQVLVENEKLTWQKESLEHIVDATSKERDDLKEKLQKAELQLSSNDSQYVTQIDSLKNTIQQLQRKLQNASSVTSISSEEVKNRDSQIQQLEAKVSSLQTDLKNSQLRILELENVKLEFTKHRSGLSETVKVYKEQIHELHNRLKDAQTTMFQPVGLSLNGEHEGSPGPECASLMSNVRLYDRTLLHLAELMNSLTNGLTDGLVQTMGVVASLQDFKLERATVDQFRACLGDVKHQLERQHHTALNYVVQVRSTLSIFEGIFKDYNELLKKSLVKQEPKPATPNVEALTSALLARGQELQTMQAEVNRLRNDKDERELLKAQMDLYKSDFEAEREAREKMACEKDNIMTDLRGAQRRVQELTSQLDEVRRLNPDVFWSATTRGAPPAPSAPSGAGARRPAPGTSRNTSGTNGAAKKMAVKKAKLSDEAAELATTPPPQRFVCPVCDQPFKTLILLQQHVDSCLL